MKIHFCLLVVFLFCLKAQTQDNCPPDRSPTSTTKEMSTDESLKLGIKSYNTNCQTCHGDQLDGMGPAGKYLNPRPRNLKTEKFVNGESSNDILKTVTEGIHGTSMLGFAQLPASERESIVAFIISLRSKK